MTPGEIESRTMIAITPANYISKAAELAKKI